MQLSQTLAESFDADMTRLLAGSGTDAPLAVAVSGGGDSMGLLALAADWAERHGRELRAVSVDHGLRPEAAEEIALAEAFCATRSIPHTTLRWTGWDGSGNLQDRARQARRSLISDWAAEAGMGVVATGHTQDDQAETFLMRLARGSGVDGLSAMFEAETFGGLRWVRPLLTTSRADLRGYLREQGIGWADDPSNENPDFERVKVRQAAAQLAELGLDTATLAATAGRMQRARHALEQSTLELAERVAVATDIGTVTLDPAPFLAAPEELQLRLLAHAIGWVSCQVYRPRLEPLQQALAAVAEGRNATLGGCLIVAGETPLIEVCREPKAVQPGTGAEGLFDGRWRVRVAPGHGDLTLRALGEDGLRMCPGWRDSGFSRRALLASPSLWKNDELIAAPFLFKTPACDVTLDVAPIIFLTSILKH